jgi:diguanylate cyclase (GGDEF)-like protein
MVFAVFGDTQRGENFIGLATGHDIADHPQWIFADLAGHRPLHAVKPTASLSACLGTLRKKGLEALPVLDDNNRFIGVVTQNSLLRGLLLQKRSSLRRAWHDARTIGEKQQQLENWSARLSSLHAAALELITVLGHASLEKEVLQAAIDALAKLLEARYGAIGILDKDGHLVKFVTTGISPEEVARIGAPPVGKGLLGMVIRENTAIRLEDLSLHPQSAGFPAHHPHMKSLLAVPISHAGRVYGRIYLAEKHQSETFTAEDEILAKGFAHSLSIVLDNAYEMEEITKAHQSLDHIAYHDSLTGLPNRMLALDRLQLALTQAHRQNSQIAVLFVDLDHFKRTNDTLGHAAGDMVLKIVAQRLLTCTRDGDTLSRLSGDEFLLMLPDINDVQDAATVAQKILNALAMPCQIDAHEVFIGASIGVSIFPDDAANPGDLLRFADTAMFHAKQEGRNAWQFFAPVMNERVHRHTQLGNALHSALKHHELELHYQPQVELKSGRIIGLEVLLRWHSHKMGHVAPSEFIPVAEDTGLIVPIGEWVLERACVQGKCWLDMGFSDLRVAVNVSARQFHHPQFIPRIYAILAASGLPPDLLELEITESLLMNGEENFIASLYELRGMGIRVSIDDFGTGYSSLSRLKKFPISTLKIDQSFVRDIMTDNDDAEIARAIIALSHSLHLEVVAEGVETQEHLEFMHRHGCDAIQGYLFSKPVKVDELTSLLREDRCLAIPP